jgi:hypothetical protein
MSKEMSKPRNRNNTPPYLPSIPDLDHEIVSTFRRGENCVESFVEGSEVVTVEDGDDKEVAANHRSLLLGDLHVGSSLGTLSCSYYYFTHSMIVLRRLPLPSSLISTLSPTLPTARHL